jgi:AAA ATPase-like protein
MIDRLGDAHDALDCDRRNRYCNIAGELSGRRKRARELPSGTRRTETRRLVGELFECAELAPIVAKGFAEPVQAWQVLRESAVDSRFEAFHAGGSLTLLIGREDELEFLRRRWRQAEGGEGQAVLLAGEPGIGKSRLVVAMQDELQGVPHIRLRYFCSSQHRDSAFYPIVTQLKRTAGFNLDDRDEARLQKLRAVLATDTDPEDVALLAELLRCPLRACRCRRRLARRGKRNVCWRRSCDSWKHWRDKAQC